MKKYDIFEKYKNMHFLFAQIRKLTLLVSAVQLFWPLKSYCEIRVNYFP